MYNIGCITMSAQGEKRPSSTPQLRAEGEEEVSAKGEQMATTELQRELGASPSGERRRMTQVKLSPSLF